MNQVKPNYNLCENEAIHLCGYVQDFGFLVILDRDGKIAAASDNASVLFGGGVLRYLDTDAYTLIERMLSRNYLEIVQHVESLFAGSDIRKVIELQLHGAAYYLSIYAVDDYVYLEFETKQDEVPSLLNLHTYSQKIDQSGQYVWNALCEVIYDVVCYDRIMVYQFLEDRSGQVIAEKVRDGLSSYMHLRYPEFDIPKQARALYLKHLTRLTADIDGATHTIQTLREASFDLTYTSVRALSPIHLAYLRNARAQASISFSIVVHGRLWGLVACQNETVRDVDLTQRRLGLFLTQYAVNRHLAMTRDVDLRLQNEFKDFELVLKEQLIIKNDLLSVLSDYLEQLVELANADGVAVYNKGEVVSYGVTPNKEELVDLHRYLDSLSVKPLFTNHRFRLKHKDNFPSNSSFAGLARIDIDESRELSIYWFREENIYEEKWSGKPEKYHVYDIDTNTFNPSPRRSFEVWKQQVHDTAVRWNDNDRLFMRRLRKLIRESMLRKSDEVKQLNERLILLNNSLDTYAYTITHDLKNPLSVVKLSSQLLGRRKDSITPDQIQRLADNILESVQLMEGLMSKVLEFSRAKIYEYHPECIDVVTTIEQIVEQCCHTYEVGADQVELGELLPVLGEKTLLYQLFLNLISNAIKYTSQRDVPKILIKSEAYGKFTKYTVKDNGIGIAAEELDDIYHLFKRLSNSFGFEGSGVGLAIVKRIADRLDAEIQIDSELGVGTTFTILFPNEYK